jgi:hypothetical protein
MNTTFEYKGRTVKLFRNPYGYIYFGLQRDCGFWISRDYVTEKLAQEAAIGLINNESTFRRNSQGKFIDHEGMIMENLIDAVESK